MLISKIKEIKNGRVIVKDSKVRDTLEIRRGLSYTSAEKDKILAKYAGKVKFSASNGYYHIIEIDDDIDNTFVDSKTKDSKMKDKG